MKNWARKIIHVDMDAFFAAVEQRDNPGLRGKPVIIGGRPDQRGVVSTCSYEARQFGVHSAMPLREAFRRCPQGIFLPGNHRKYSAVSREIQQIFCAYTPLVEPISLDEAFLDVTGCEGLFGPVVEVGRQLRDRIGQEVGLTASVGISYNKFLAKVASDLQKPAGFVVIGPEDMERVLWPLPVQCIWGVGEKTAQLLSQLKWLTIGQIAQQPESVLKEKFGMLGEQLYALAKGLDDRPVYTGREVKSVSNETTFAQDINERDKVEAALLELAQEVGRKLRKQGLMGRVVTLKLRYADFTTITRAETLAEHTNWDGEIYRVAQRLLNKNWNGTMVRLVGVTVSKLDSGDIGGQLAMFGQNREKEEKLAEALDKLKDKFGEKVVTRARLLK